MICHCLLRLLFFGGNILRVICVAYHSLLFCDLNHSVQRNHVIMNRSAFLKVQLRFNASNVFLLLIDRLITELNPKFQKRLSRISAKNNLDSVLISTLLCKLYLVL